ncbi:type II toxin-antitoxin system HicA family toxin [Agromyces aerolatus]|uniref:type II toxin-antitoxin system HicA family toxin n=1 Tax=Agromyces sp. LY-1074 TaxID=3074080 RepID=UPI0037C1222B
MVREVRHREVEQFLAASGWRVLRSKGGHDVWGSPNGSDSLAIPRHSRVSPGVVRQIITKLPNAPRSWR